MRIGRSRIIGGLAAGVLATGLLGAVAAAATPSHHRHGPSWRLVDTGTTEHFRGLAAVSRRVAWLGGYDGTVLRTADGGRTWRNVSPAGAGTLQFRDIAATDSRHAVAMAAGSGTDSRLYETSDGGRTWKLAYQNTEPAAFFDCMSFADQDHGLVLSDPVNGRFRILATSDGGRHWRVRSDAGMPPALTGEAGFAAGGECLATSGRDAWFGGGGGPVSRIFHSTDRGRTWTVRSTPIPSSDSGGVIAIAFRTPAIGVALGGSFADPAASVDVAATSRFDGPWRSARTQPHGYRSGAAFVPHTRRTVIAVGLTGSDISHNDGRTWSSFDDGQFDTVACTDHGACWASGDLGRVAVLRGRGR